MSSLDEPLVDINVSTFNWSELHGQTVKVHVYEQDGFQIAALQLMTDFASLLTSTDEYFIVSIKDVNKGETK